MPAKKDELELDPGTYDDPDRDRDETVPVKGKPQDVGQQDEVPE